MSDPVISELPGFEEVEHASDLALRVRGRDFAHLLVNAALGLASLIADEIHMSVPLEEKFLELKAIDKESLLVAWLSELAYLAESELLVFSDFHFKHVSFTELKAVAKGNRVDSIHKHHKQVKAVTYHGLKIIREEQYFTATIVFDV